MRHCSASRRQQKKVKPHSLFAEQLEDRLLLSVTSDSFRPIGTTPWDPTSPLSSMDQSPAYRPPLSYEQVFNLHSKPDSNFTIYLDFDGHITIGTDWNDYFEVDTIVSPPFNIEGDADSFSPLELERIVIAWQRTAEDFAPFDINVTTREPLLSDLTYDGPGDTRWGARAVVTDDNFADCGCGGFAFIGSFNDPIDTPTFIFNKTLDSLGETFSHEVGHMLYLFHDGTTTGQEYYPGHGLGTPLSWGAIMGAPFTANITQWDRGEYRNANNQGDDLLEITTLNGFGYRTDDYGNTRQTASPLNVSGSTDLSAFGYIERTTDRDFFYFYTGGGPISLSVETLTHRPNLDVWAGIYDTNGTILQQKNTPNSTHVSFENVNLAAGRYFLRVEGVGSHDSYNANTDTVNPPSGTPPWQQNTPTGYSDYGSLGQYLVRGTVTVPGGNRFSIQATDAVKSEGASGTVPFTFTVTRSGNTSIPASVQYAFVPTLPSMPGESVPFPANANDFAPGTVFSGQLVFQANEVSKTITFQVQGDAEFEPDEFFDVLISNPTLGWYIADSRATGKILSDESRFSIPTQLAQSSAFEGPALGTLLRWRQVQASSGAFDEWAIDNINIASGLITENFDPNLTLTNFHQLSNGTVNTRFGGSGNSLFFSGTPQRWATARFASLHPGMTVSFSLIIGNSMNGGDNAEAGEDVVLEYSTDGGSKWVVLNTYITTSFHAWTTITETLPDAIDDFDVSKVSFSVIRDGGTGAEAFVHWQVEPTGSSPASPNDFVGGVFPSGQVHFPAGQSSAVVQIPIQGDLLFESNETFQLRLTNVTGNGQFSIDQQFQAATGTILTDDYIFRVDVGTRLRWRQVQFTGGHFDNWGLDNISVTRGLLQDDFDPTIDLAQWSLVSGAVVNTNFGGSGNSLFFTGDELRILESKPIPVISGDHLSFQFIFGDDFNGGEIPELGEDVVLEYSVNQGETWIELRRILAGTTMTWTNFSVVIPPEVATPGLAINEGNAGLTPFTFQVPRIGDNSVGTIIPWEVRGTGAHPADASDFAGGVFPSGALIFGPGEATKTIVVQVVGDRQYEPDETFELVLLGGHNVSATAIILNDDPFPTGDFNEDGFFDCFDINDLVANIAGQTGNLNYDMNLDGLLNQLDVTAWLSVAGAANLPSGNPYLPGDANLDGVVDGSDFGVWNANKFTFDRGWCGADFTANGVVDGSDFGIWNANKFRSSFDNSGRSQDDDVAIAAAWWEQPTTHATLPSALPRSNRVWEPTIGPQPIRQEKRESVTTALLRPRHVDDLMAKYRSQSQTAIQVRKMVKEEDDWA